MSQPWVPETVVTPELAIELIRAHFPELEPRTAELLGNGWDNTAYLIDGELVFRFPRREIAVALMECEVRVLRRVAPLLPLAVPIPQWAASPSDGYAWPFAGYRRLGGTSASQVALTDEQRTAAAPVLGAFLRALHSCPRAGLDLPDDHIGRLDVAGRVPVLRERLAALVGRGRLPSADAWLALFRDEIPSRGEEGVLVHGDMYSRHLLVDDDGRLAGVIDWGDVHAGDPAVDVSIAWSFLPAAARPAFFSAYGDVPERTRRLARLRATSHTISTCWYADAVGDAPLLAESLKALRHVLEE